LCRGLYLSLMNKQVAVSTYEIGILGKMDATEVAESIRKGDFTAEEAARCAVERASATQEALNAVVAEQYDIAIKMPRH
jgi:Asp-tRNA(Asn)/Glu-tRNA(Gln) amidotransferase A subunit family amidase